MVFVSDGLPIVSDVTQANRILNGALPPSKKTVITHVPFCLVRENATPDRVAVGAAVVVAALAISALVNRFVAKKAERNNPPTGKFVVVGWI
jgi:hypothetical protein